MVLWKDRNQRKTNVSRSKGSKQAMQLAEHKLKPWQKVEKRTTKGIEAQGKKANKHKLEYASQSTKHITEIKTRHQICSSTSSSRPTFSKINIFRIGRIVMEASSLFEMLQYCNLRNIRRCFNMPIYVTRMFLLQVIKIKIS